MLDKQYRLEIELELISLRKVLVEINIAIEKSRYSDPDNILRAAMGSYLAQFYNGIENILKRIAKGCSVNLPKSENWHRDLFLMYCEGGNPLLPILFDGQLESDMNAFRKFRHVVFHGYSFSLDWDTMVSGVERIDTTFETFCSKLKQSDII